MMGTCAVVRFQPFLIMFLRSLLRVANKIQKSSSTTIISSPLWHTQTRMSTSGKVTEWVKPGDSSGEFKRQVSSFRESISNEPGAKFPVEKGRYHLYISYACPWVCPLLSPRACLCMNVVDRTLCLVSYYRRQHGPSSRGS